MSTIAASGSAAAAAGASRPPNLRAGSRARKTHASAEDLSELGHQRAHKALTIVIKLGTSSIVSPTYPFLPHLHLLSSIVETVIQLRELGHRVVLCSSGAIGVGLRRMGLKERGKGLSQKQALAAVGQGRLIALWDNLFSQLDQPIAQILLTRMDISDRTRYLNAQNTFSELLNMGVVPIVNENDTVSVSEIKFGDNDTLSAISSAIVHADYLFLLTDVECLYTDNPRNNPEAKPVFVVRDIEKVKQNVSTSTLGTSLGTGGMSTKLIAADLATAAGTTTVIMHSEHVRDVFEVIKDGAGPSRDVAGLAPGEDGEGVRCTRFLRREVALKDRKWWIAHGLHAAGTVVIDEGAYRAIRKRDSGNRILPAGVVRVEGTFASSQAVRLYVRRRRKPGPDAHTSLNGAERGETDQSGRSSIDETTRTPSGGGRKRAIKAAGAGTASPTPAQIIHEITHAPPLSPAVPLRPVRASRPTSLLANEVDAELDSASDTDRATAPSAPDTPSIQPIASMSSSIASLDPLNRISGPVSPVPPAAAAVQRAILLERERAERGGEPSIAALSDSLAAASLAVGVVGESGRKNGRGEPGEWEEIEIGKGLALYNSMEMDRIKGMKSSHIEQVLGYCETEHVVDSITYW